LAHLPKKSNPLEVFEKLALEEEKLEEEKGENDVNFGESKI
jgi:hypothetical protein